jgi:hypothetical protein
MEQKQNESNEEYLKRLFAEGDSAVSNLKKITSDMKKDGVVGFCKECGVDIYKDKKHKCN